MITFQEQKLSKLRKRKRMLDVIKMGHFTSLTEEDAHSELACATPSNQQQEISSKLNS